MRFEVAGPLRVIRDDGSMVRLPRGRVRHLLAALLLVRAPVPEDRLCEWLGEGGAPIAGSTLRTHMTALRRALGAAGHRVHTEPAGYTITVEPEELDICVFRDLSERGRCALDDGDQRNAAKLLHEAGALWREPALADLPGSPQLWSQVMELAEERQLAVEALTDARLALGEHRELIPELAVRTEMNPPQERAFEQLMTAFYRSGRRAEACEAYRRLHERLTDSYGIDPGPAAQKVYQWILNDDEALRLQ
jgi:DNA-binding SARP family transcriptional activator